MKGRIKEELNSLFLIIKDAVAQFQAPCSIPLFLFGASNALGILYERAFGVYQALVVLEGVKRDNWEVGIMGVFSLAENTSAGHRLFHIHIILERTFYHM